MKKLVFLALLTLSIGCESDDDVLNEITDDPQAYPLKSALSSVALSGDSFPAKIRLSCLLRRAAS